MLLGLWLVLFLGILLISYSQIELPSIQQILDIACEGDLYLAQRMAKVIMPPSAESLHILSGLDLILNSKPKSAVLLHKQGKSLNPSVIPPLAKMHLDGKICGGLGDLFYVSAVIIKELVDTNISNSSLFSCLTTLVTLMSDSGLAAEAETHLIHAIDLTKSMNNDIINSSINIGGISFLSLRFRASLMTPGVFDSIKHLKLTRSQLENRIYSLHSDLIQFQHISSHSTSSSTFLLPNLDEFVMSPTFYFVYQGLSDRLLLEKLHESYGLAHPPLRAEYISSFSLSPSLPHRRLKVGFVSSHFRRHSICKLFCGLISTLNQESFEVFVFSSLSTQSEDQLTHSLRESLESPHHFISVGKTFVVNRVEVTSREIDILVYLDVGMDPSTSVWAGSRLAPIQICLWGHPTTTGLPHMDYFLSSFTYHSHPNPALRENPYYIPHLPTDARGDNIYDIPLAESSFVSHSSELSHAYNESELFTEQLILFDSVGFYFERPKLSALTQLISKTIPSISTQHNQMESEIKIDFDGSPHMLPSTLSQYPTHSQQSDPHEILFLSLRPDQYYKTLQDSLELSISAATKNSGEKELNVNSASEMLASLISEKRQGAKLILCPQHLPKLHPHFDMVLRGILEEVPNGLLVFLNPEKKQQWVRTLTQRWRKTIGGISMRRIVWMPSLTPEQYLSLLAVGDLMIDPFPFGGGVTTLESLAVCTPVLTSPSLQSVPRLAAGMIQELSLSLEMQQLMLVTGASADHYPEQEYILKAAHLLGNKLKDVNPILSKLRKEICNSVIKEKKLFSNSKSNEELELFLTNLKSQLITML